MVSSFSASMMCADCGHLEDEVRRLETAGIDAFHIDIMDGEFVNNFGMGMHDLRYIRKATKRHVECHLMIREPARYVGLFAECGVDTLYVHPESGYRTGETVEQILRLGITPGIAINPTTTVESIYELLYLAKRVLVMAVTPGHAGQAFMPNIDKKLRKLIKLKDEYDFEIFWDGHGSVENVKKYAPLGVDGFVLGTAALFGKRKSYADILSELRGNEI